MFTKSMSRIIAFRTIWAFWAMMRPLQLLAVLAVALTGAFAAIAQGATLKLPYLISGLLPLLAVAISIHYANEYADAETDTLTTRTPFSGGSGALVALPRLRKWAGRLMVFWLLLGLGFALLLRLPTAVIGVLCLGAFGGWMYSLPPLCLAWNGWGEATNALLGGMTLMAYGYALLMQRIDDFVILASIPFTLLVFINLLATTWPDRIADAQVGKYTLATRWTVQRLRRLYLVAAVLAVSSTLILTQMTLPTAMHGALLLLLPLLLWGAMTYTRQESPAPTVFTMIAMMSAQLLVWGNVAFGFLPF